MSEPRRRLQPLRLDRHPPTGSRASETAAPPARSASALGANPVGGVSPTQRQATVHGRPPVVPVVPILVIALVIAICVIVWLIMKSNSDIRTSLAPFVAPCVASSTGLGHDGVDPKQPIFPEADRGFVDERGGWGWGDRCFGNINAGKLGWAKAECDQAMRVARASPQPGASLLYLEGLIAKAAGDTKTASSDFTESLALRENAEVRAALKSLSR